MVPASSRCVNPADAAAAAVDCADDVDEDDTQDWCACDSLLMLCVDETSYTVHCLVPAS